ncbi:hypothetical protein [Flavobacterium sp.]|uniref:hypothetical protein n=1 Tax=Flavobacterium sp. TaxID=239 RepID=UPI002626C422|nr:hypothetical protein [Flavobacterium sp.]
MTSFEILQRCITSAEGLSAFLGILFYNKVKSTYWKYFAWYCILIFLNEVISLFVLKNYLEFKKYFFDIYAIPIQFIFFFWLYALKSLKNVTLFKFSIFIYFISFLPHLFYEKEHGLINSMSYTIACLILLVLCVLEFKKQVISDDIIYFKTNKMFYINLGVLLFYVGTMPFYAFMQYFYNNHPVVFVVYKYYSISVGILMYLLFSASFIWGKSKT